MGDTKISEAAAAVWDAMRDGGYLFSGGSFAAAHADDQAAMVRVVESVLPHLQGKGVPVAWVHEGDVDRVISAAQKATAIRDGGASATSVKPYTLPVYAHPQPAALNEVSGDSGEMPLMVSSAPERIWLQVGDDDYSADPFPYEEEVTWCSQSAVKSEVAYVRADLAATGKQQVGEVQGDGLLGYVRATAIKALREDDEVTGVMVHVEELTDSVPVYLAARPPVCETCRGWGLIGGPSFYAPDEGGAPCPDCSPSAPPAQGIDLGRLRRAMELMQGVSRTLVDWAYDDQREAINIVKALIGQRDAAPGVK